MVEPIQEEAWREQLRKRQNETEMVFSDKDRQHIENLKHVSWSNFIAARGELYRSCSLDTFKCAADTREDREKQSVIRSQLVNLNLSNWEEVTSMIFFGRRGTGKDHLMAACLRKLIAQCVIKDTLKRKFRLPVIRWVHGPKLFAERRDNIDDKRSEKSFVNQFTSVDVLCISDLSTQEKPLTDGQKEILYWIIDDRYSRELPTWLTLNVMNRDGLSGLLGDTIADRLVHDALTFYFDWPSYRKSRKA